MWDFMFKAKEGDRYESLKMQDARIKKMETKLRNFIAQTHVVVPKELIIKLSEIPEFDEDDEVDIVDLIYHED